MANFLWNTNSPDQRISTPHTIYSFVIKAATLDGAPHPKLVLNATLNSHTRISFGRDGQKFPSVNVSVWRVNYCCCLSFRALLNTHSLLINVLLLSGCVSARWEHECFSIQWDGFCQLYSINDDHVIEAKLSNAKLLQIKTKKKHTFKLKFN